MDKVRVFAGRCIPMISLVITVLSYALMTYLIFQYFTMGRVEVQPLPENASVEVQFFNVILPYVTNEIAQVIIILAIVATYLFLPGFVSAVLTLPLALFWKRSLRILVLRRFAMRERSRPLKHLLRRYVSPAEHVYTLADRDIKIPWYIRYPVVLTQLAFLHFRLRRIGSQKAISRLCSAMDVRWARNINWFVSTSKTFALRCSDALWHELVAAMTEKVDAVVIDISERSHNLEWEIQNCIEQSQLEKVVFLCTASKRNEALSLLGNLGLQKQVEDRLITYDTGDVQRLSAFLPSRRRTIQKVRRPRLRSQLAAVSMMIGPFLWGLIFIVGIAIVSSNIKSSDQDTAMRPNQFEKIVSLVRDESTRESSFPKLLAILSSLVDQHTDWWIEDFKESVVPLFEELWDTDTAWRIQILNVLKDIGSPGASGIWRKALLSVPNSGGPMFDLVQDGIKTSRSRENITGLLHLFERGEPHVRLRIVQTLGNLGDTSVVPMLLGKIFMELEGPQFPDLRTEAQAALRKILLSTTPLKPYGPVSKPCTVVAILSSPGQNQPAFLVRLLPSLAYNYWQRHNHNLKDQDQLKLYGNVEIINLMVSYVTSSGWRIFQEFPILKDRAKGLLEFAERYDAALLEIMAEKGINDLARGQLHLVRNLGINRVAIFLNMEHAQFESDQLASINREIDELLSELSYHGKDVVIVTGSIPTSAEAVMDEMQREAMDELFEGINSWPVRPPSRDRPAIFPIADVFNILTYGLLLTGYLEQGQIHPGDVLEAVGNNKRTRVVIEEHFDFLETEDEFGLWIRTADPSKLMSGQVLGPLGELKVFSKFKAEAYILSEEEGGPRNLMISTIGDRNQRAACSAGAAVVFQFRNANVSPKHILWSFDLDKTPHDLRIADLMPPRGYASLEVELFAPVVLYPGLRFRFYANDQLVGAGAITEILE